MKIVLSIFCWIIAAFCIYFPFSYFKSGADIKEVKLSHILVETQEEADDIKKQLDESKGNNFEELVEKYSKCTSKKNKGNLGYMMRNRLLPEIEKVAFSMPVNTISEPVQSEVGWHILKVYDISYFSDRDNFYYQYDIDHLMKELNND